MDSLDTALTASHELSAFLEQHIGTRSEVEGSRRVCALALFTICLAHRAATILLIEAGAFSSAHTLARAALEAYVTAEWFDLKADDAMARAIAKGERGAPSFEKMAQALRKVHPMGEGFELLRGHYGTLSDYAHSEARQITRWIGPEGISPRHSPAEMVEVLCLLDLVAVLAASRHEHLAGRSVDVFHAPMTGVSRRAGEVRRENVERLARGSNTRHA